MSTYHISCVMRPHRSIFDPPLRLSYVHVNSSLNLTLTNRPFPTTFVLKMLSTIFLGSSIVFIVLISSELFSTCVVLRTMSMCTNIVRYSSNMSSALCEYSIQGIALRRCAVVVGNLEHLSNVNIYFKSFRNAKFWNTRNTRFKCFKCF